MYSEKRKSKRLSMIYGTVLQNIINKLETKLLIVITLRLGVNFVDSKKLMVL